MGLPFSKMGRLVGAGWGPDGGPGFVCGPGEHPNADAREAVGHGTLGFRGRAEAQMTNVSHACKENIKIRGLEAVTGGRRAGERRADGEAE